MYFKILNNILKIFFYKPFKLFETLISKFQFIFFESLFSIRILEVASLQFPEVPAVVILFRALGN